MRLAQMLALGSLPTVWVPPQPVRAVRRLLEIRERLGSYRRALANQARAVLSRHGILLPKGPHALGQVTQAMVCKLPPAEQAILVVAWRMLCIGETYRAAQEGTLRRKEAGV